MGIEARMIRKGFRGIVVVKSGYIIKHNLIRINVGSDSQVRRGVWNAVLKSQAWCIEQPRI